MPSVEIVNDWLLIGSFIRFNDMSDMIVDGAKVELSPFNGGTTVVVVDVESGIELDDGSLGEDDSG